eukprot:1186926-Prorocentrum_minimum.AAC.3
MSHSTLCSFIRLPRSPPARESRAQHGRHCRIDGYKSFLSQLTIGEFNSPPNFRGHRMSVYTCRMSAGPRVEPYGSRASPSEPLTFDP